MDSGPPPLPTGSALSQGKERGASGKQGENYVPFFLERLDFEKRFEVKFLGDTWPLFDFLLEAHVPYGPRPFAFLSVRSTKQPRQKSGNLEVGLSLDELRRMNAHPAPTYLIGVDVSTFPPEAFVASVNADIAKLPSLPVQHPLDKDAAAALWDEVVEFWYDRPASMPVASRFALTLPTDE